MNYEKARFSNPDDPSLFFDAVVEYTSMTTRDAEISVPLIRIITRELEDTWGRCENLFSFRLNNGKTFLERDGQSTGFLLKKRGDGEEFFDDYTPAAECDVRYI